MIAQDTGFSKTLPTGRGLLAFTEPDEALEAIALIADDPAGHARAARKVAAECFDARTVLAALLNDAYATGGLPAATSRRFAS